MSRNGKRRSSQARWASGRERLALFSNMCERRKVRVKVEHTVEYSDPIEIASGEKVSVGREDDEFPGWKWCKAADGREGWIPVELLACTGTEAIVVDDYSARELAVQPGEELIVEDARHDWLLVRNAHGKRGWIPERNTEPMRE